MTAQRPDGRDPGQRVSFTRQGADRIARVVRTVEQGDKKCQPLKFVPRPQAVSGGSGSSMRLAVYTATAAWRACDVSAATSSTTFASATALVQFVRGNTATATAVNFTATLPRKTTVATAAIRSVTLANIDSLWVLVGAQC